MNVHTHTSTVALIWTSIHTLIREALPRVCAQTHALRLFTHTRYPRPKYNIGYSNIQSRVNILFHSHQSADCWFTPTPWLTYGWQTTCKLWQHDPTRSDLTCGFAEFFFFFSPAAFSHHSIWKDKTTSCFVSGWALIGSSHHCNTTRRQTSQSVWDS